MAVCLNIATYERTPLLRRSLQRLREKPTQPDEIVVVDDGGSDGCELIPGEFPDLPIRYLYTHHPGQQCCSHAHNVGLVATEAEFVLCAEPEVMFETDVVGELLAGHVAHGQMATAGTARKVQADGTVKTVACGEPYAALYRRDWLMEIGGWDEGFEVWGWEDIDLFTRISIRFGVGQWRERQTIVTHQYHPQAEPAISHGPNHRRFMSKGFHPRRRPDDPDVVIPRGPDFGRPLVRSSGGS